MADKPNIFTDIAAGKPANIQPGQVVAAREWFRQAAQKITDINPTTLFKQNEKNLVRSVNMTSIGSMYMYQYDPKHKATLPYYDTQPLVFIESMKPGGWAGLNIHYLPPFLRAKLMDALYGITIKEGDKMKVQLSYGLLNSARKFKHFGPCYHRYLSSHVVSRILFIEPNNWDAAMMLPTARFEKASQEQVWRQTGKA